MKTYKYNISESIDISKLSVEINRDISINKTLKYITFNQPNDLQIVFEEDLKPSEVSVLEQKIKNHNKSFIGKKNYYVKEYDSRNIIMKEVWYNQEINGIFVEKVEEIEYVYKDFRKSELIKKIHRLFWADGTIRDIDETEYYSSTKNIIVEKYRKIQ